MQRRFIPLGLAVSALFSLVSAASAHAVQCPGGIEVEDCVANDLQPTGTEVIRGPESCTEGQVFSGTVRILFENGGGANTRYNVGFFVGDAGEPVIGGSSCTFDSLQPLEPPLDLTGGSGGFRELNGDACGDIEKSEVTYKDIELGQILCKDDDGDGNVDISYVLTWVNNGNLADCQDPLDPTEFEPSPPKCRSDLEYDLPIKVEDPATIEVDKEAFPFVLREPGGLVRYAVTVINTSPESSDPVLITNILDEPYGDITNLTDCVMPFPLSPSQSRTCFFITEVTGVAGDVIPDTVTVLGRDDEGQGVEASDSTEVRIIDFGGVPEPGNLGVVKFASPSLIDEPGGQVQYDLLVFNNSPTAVELTSLSDDLYGDLDGKGNCAVPQTLAGVNSIYYCSFQEQVSGQPGDVIRDTVTAQGFDATTIGNALIAQDSAFVIIDDVSSNIEVTKYAKPKTVPEPGANVNFVLQVQNTSVSDTVTIDNLLDSNLGAPKGDCVTPFTLQPGGDTYSCQYSGIVSGNAGEYVTNVVTATGVDDDGRDVLDFGVATVEITGIPPSLEVQKVAVPPFALETGSPVAYIVGIQNTSSSLDPVTITALRDEVGGVVTDLDGVGSCDLTPNGQPLVLQPAPSPDSFYICGWVEQDVSGAAGTTLTDTVTAAGRDDEGVPADASDSATVTFLPQAAAEPVLELFKFASPQEVQEPGDQVTYTLVLANGLDDANGSTLTVTSLQDEVGGVVTDLDGVGTCALPIVLSPQQADQPPMFELCTFTAQVNGDPGDVVTNTVTAVAIDQSDQQAQAQATADVTVVDVPSSLTVTKTAIPSTVLEPGEGVTFEIVVENTSQADSIFLDSLVDNVHGDLMDLGLCPPPSTLFPDRNQYRCSFTAFVGGEPGYEERNTVVAAGTDDDGERVQNSAQATVTVLDTPPSILTTKTASPSAVPTSGGRVTFTVTTTNTSEVDTVEIDTLEDSVFGDLDGRGDCSVPQSLAPGQSYSCSFDEQLAGMVNETHQNQVLAEGTSDDGEPVSSRATAIVTFFFGALRNIPVLGQAGLVALVLLLGFLGVHRIRARR